MNRCIRLVLLVTCAAACTTGDPEESAQDSRGAGLNAESVPEAAEVTGLSAYEMACASCHESGAGNAPLTGDAAAWAGRSPMWQAVLADHVNSGYMEMPVKGGSPGLSEAAILRAVDHMLSLTYPDRPPD